MLCYLLKIGGSLEDQIAGLLHDISHTASSHVSDFVFVNQDASYHEEIYTPVIESSEIPLILAEHGYDYEKILFNHSKWTILEQSTPGLCADRIDYTIRDMFVYGQVSLEEVHEFLDDLFIRDGKIFLQNIGSAEWFVKTYYKEVIDFFFNSLNIYSYKIMTVVLKLSMEKSIIDVNDFLMKDKGLIEKIANSNDIETISMVKKLHPKVQVAEDEEN